jgi:hypothetical protein
MFARHARVLYTGKSGTLVRKMNGFDLQAVGFIACRDLIGEGIGVFFGMKPKFDREKYDGLRERWYALTGSIADDRMKYVMALDEKRKRNESEPLLEDLRTRIDPRRIPFGKESQKAMKAFLESLVDLSPETFGYRAFRARAKFALLRASIAASVCYTAGHYASPEFPMLGSLALVGFILTCLALRASAQFFFAFRLQKKLGVDQAPNTTPSS